MVDFECLCDSRITIRVACGSLDRVLICVPADFKKVIYN